MIEIKQVKTQDEVNYTFVEKLMHTAFPQEERRDTVQQREYSDNNPRFTVKKWAIRIDAGTQAISRNSSDDCS